MAPCRPDPATKRRYASVPITKPSGTGSPARTSRISDSALPPTSARSSPGASSAWTYASVPVMAGVRVAMAWRRRLSWVSWIRAGGQALTATQPFASTERSIASQMAAARAPSANVGRPRWWIAAVRLGVHRGVGVGDVALEALRIALRRGRPGGSPAGAARPSRGWGRGPGWWPPPRSRSTAASGVLLVEDAGAVHAVHLQPQTVLAAGAELADDRRPDHAVLGPEHDQRGVLGGHVDQRCVIVWAAGGAEAGRRGGRSLRDRDRGGGHQLRDPVTGHPLGQIAPVGADVAEGARRAAELRVHPPRGGHAGRAASPGGSCRGSG